MATAIMVRPSLCRRCCFASVGVKGKRRSMRSRWEEDTVITNNMSIGHRNVSPAAFFFHLVPLKHAAIDDTQSSHSALLLSPPHSQQNHTITFIIRQLSTGRSGPARCRTSGLLHYLQRRGTGGSQRRHGQGIHGHGRQCRSLPNGRLGRPRDCRQTRYCSSRVCRHYGGR